jgi:hypothetical protein
VVSSRASSAGSGTNVASSTHRAAPPKRSSLLTARDPGPHESLQETQADSAAQRMGGAGDAQSCGEGVEAEAKGALGLRGAELAKVGADVRVGA